jgi:hypothetical protein
LEFLVIRHRLTAVVAALFSVGALSTASLLTTADAARPADRPVAERASSLPFVTAKIGTAHKVTLPSTLRPGVRLFKVTSQVAEGEVMLIHLKAPYTLDEALADFGAAFEHNDLEALNRVYDNVIFIGSATASPGKPNTFIANLAKGKYLAVDFSLQAPTADMFAPFTVTGDPTGSTAPTSPTITATGDKTWAKNPASIPAKGMLRFRNVARSPHFIEIDRLKAGKTYADWVAWVNAGGNGPPPIRNEGSFYRDVVSPGHSYQFKYGTIPGKYVVMCWMPDRKTGMPHVLMGMSRPLTIR